MQASTRKRAVDMMESTGIIAHAYGAAEELRLKANASLDGIPDSKHKQALLKPSDFLLKRHV